MPSLAPSSTISRSGFCFNNQSTRRTPPAVVSPLCPAFSISVGYPISVNCCSTKAGYAELISSPSPAVRLSPKITILGFNSAVASGVIASARFSFGDVSVDACSLVVCTVQEKHSKNVHMFTS